MKKKTKWAVKIGNKPIEITWYTEDGKRITSKAIKTFKIKNKSKSLFRQGGL